MHCLVLRYSEEKYSTRWSHSAVSIGKCIFPNGIIEITLVYTGYSYFQVRTTKIALWVCNFFLKLLNIKYLGFWWLIPSIQMTFQYLFPYYEKLKSFVQTFTRYNQILFSRNNYVCQIRIFIFDIVAKAKLTTTEDMNN